jgi:hypothetical protein
MTRLHKRSVFRPRLIQPPSPDDTRGATPERVRHAQGFVERGNLGRGRTGIVTMRDSPIERARARNVINQAQYTAAAKYRHHWYRAGLASPLSSVELYVNKDNYGAAVDLIRSLIIEHVSYLQSIRHPEDFLRHVEWMKGNESVHFRLDLALTYARVGRAQECRDILRKLAEKVDQEERAQPDRFGLKNPLDEHIKQAARAAQHGPERLASLLDEWEVMNVETLGLQASWQPSRPSRLMPGSIS